MRKIYPYFCVISIFLSPRICYAQKIFSPAELLADVDFMNEKIMEIHPNPFSVIDSAKYFSEVEKLKNAITEPMSSNDFYRLIAPVTVKLGDGHTGLTVDQSQMNITKLRFPFDIFIQDDRIFIAENHSLHHDIILGSEIIKINGTPSAEVLSTLLKYSPGESVEFKTRTIESIFPMVYRFNYGEYNEFLVEIKQSEIITTYRIDNISNQEQRIPEFMKPSSFYFLDEVAVLDLRNFQATNFNSFINSTFAELADKKTTALIIDLRYNTGGQSALADSLLSYLTSRQYQSMVSDSIKISFATSSYIEQLKSMNLGRREGDVYVWNGIPVVPRTRANKFDGSLYVLTSPMTYSTAGYFANVIQCNKLGTIIGSETGQPMIAYGDTYTYVLPNTRLRCGIAKQKFVFCCAEKNNQGVVPDHIIERNPQDALEGVDNVMEYALRLIGERSN